VTMTNTIASRAFAVWWKDLERWAIPTSILLGQSLPAGWERVRVGTLVRQVTTRVKIDPDNEYKMAGVRWYGEGVFHRETVRGDAMSANQVAPLVAGALIYNRLFAWKTSFAVVPPELADCYVSSEFPQFIPDKVRILSEYLYLFCTREATIRAVNAASTGSSAVSRNRFKEEEFLNFEISLPPLKEQKAIVARWRKVQDELAAIRNRIVDGQNVIESRFLSDLGLKPPTEERKPRCFAVTWQMFERWDLTYFRRPAFNPKSVDFPNVHLIEIIHPLSKTTQRLNPSEFPTSDFSYIGMENVESGSGRLVGNTHRQGAEIKSSCIAFRREHILYGKLRPYLRKVVDCSELDFDQGIASSEFLSLRPKEMACQAWLTHYLRSSTVAEQAKVAIGARMPRISIDVFLNIWVPLPPLSVQKQIMERVATGREEISRERETADHLAHDIKAEVEALILGTKNVSDL